MRRTAAAALVAVLAAIAAGCGSDLGPASTPAAVPVRIQLAQAAPGLAAGVRDAIALIGAVRVSSTADADLVVTDTPGAAAAAARTNPGTHVLLLGPRPTEALAPNVRVVEYDRGDLAYMAGALAALEAPSIAVAEPGSILAGAFRAGADAVRQGAAVATVSCGATTSAQVVYIPAPTCRPDAAGAQVIAPDRLAGAHMLGLLGPRPAVVVAETARSVQDGIFQPGIALEGLRDDAVGFAWISPALPPAAVRRLQDVEDTVRAETAPVPTIAP
ncbi:MAG TPA: hypothetical protein VGL44_16400 [Gaiellales bacterium]